MTTIKTIPTILHAAFIFSPYNTNIIIKAITSPNTAKDSGITNKVIDLPKFFSSSATAPTAAGPIVASAIPAPIAPAPNAIAAAINPISVTIVLFHLFICSLFTTCYYYT